MRTLSVVATVALLAVVVGIRADEKPAPDQAFDDATFVTTAASGGMHEVELGKIAQTQAKRDEVKKFAEQLVKDHTKANEELREAAKSANLRLPERMTEKHQKHLDMFKDYKGTDFDADYMKHMVSSHTESVALFTKASKEAKSKEVRDFATKQLPGLQAHLDQAKKLSESR